MGKIGKEKKVTVLQKNHGLGFAEVTNKPNSTVLLSKLFSDLAHSSSRSFIKASLWNLVQHSIAVKKRKSNAKSMYIA